MHATEIGGRGQTKTRRIRKNHRIFLEFALTFTQPGSVYSSAFRGTSAQQRHLVDVRGTALINPGPDLNPAQRTHRWIVNGLGKQICP
ncbi:hypothetical protein GDO81_028119 [Engystomops pustulosus]|uniref:Uncharacterized protein n=1 Tax=Engystomops pustulosus TaxID=76066 RepID=A0AAV6Z7F1_ENGPU|nr:hypothetical protein GDO81_028119 [Engystomops pustulosus]